MAEIIPFPNKPKKERGAESDSEELQKIFEDFSKTNDARMTISRLCEYIAGTKAGFTTERGRRLQQTLEKEVQETIVSLGQRRINADGAKNIIQGYKEFYGPRLAEEK